MEKTGVYETLRKIGYELPIVGKTGGVFKPVVRHHDILYVSGQGTIRDGKVLVSGKLGKSCSIAKGREAAVHYVLNALSQLDAFLGDLNQIDSVIKILGFVASEEGFNDQPKVIDGASELLQTIFGDHGVGVRSAIGVFELPRNMAVEIEFIFSLRA